MDQQNTHGKDLLPVQYTELTNLINKFQEIPLVLKRTVESTLNF